MHDKEISLKELLETFWQAKIYIVTSALCALICAIIFLVVATPRYQAVMIVAPADGYALGDYASSVQYDAIAALPFWRPKDQEGASTDFYRFIYTIRGASAANILIKDSRILSSINRNKKGREIRSAEELSVYLNKNIRIDPLGATPLRRISYQHPNADFSSAMLRKLHLVADQMIRRERRQQSQRRIEYLEKALRKTIHPDHRKGITNLLMQQEHIKMLANLDEAYAAIVVEPANSSPKPVWPNKMLVLIVFIFLGALLGYIVWFFKTSGRASS